ncbi:hypothetical protein [Bradyrhizobium sp. AUGA SZCCT0042]|uniref:hypothetical protein n=1 Tax=Bradyrhizobium sp. AUGA SZCCT0042 TaxID=2807651 RepID=UPI001BAD45C4|nr:hypothetical protein [Bradyrhizobium sp. AUGA SZCCT0042]MBR1229042.1 hypothetical protein [Bradyrhizobium sp. AUGA SZCCT0176]MBR1299023.1 hypothetical protein [Bradyrhizobium sp. AUGA SZCCT0042]
MGEKAAPIPGELRLGKVGGLMDGELRRKYHSGITQNQDEQGADRQQSRKVDAIFRQKNKHAGMEHHETRQHQSTRSEIRVKREYRGASEPQKNYNEDGRHYLRNNAQSVGQRKRAQGARQRYHNDLPRDVSVG